MLRKATIAAVLLLAALGCALGVIHMKTKADTLSVLVVYKDGTETYLDTLQHLSQTLVVHAGIEHAAWPVADRKLKRYDAVYVDRALADPDSAEAEDLGAALERYVREGGFLFAENELHSVLPPELIGAASLVPVEKLPETLVYPEPAEPDAAGLQSIVRLFHGDMIAHYSEQRLPLVALGMGVVPSTATSLASTEEGVALYTLNRYGKGQVLFCSGLLPSGEYVTGFDLQPREDTEQSYFNFMYATGGYQLRNEFLAFLSKQKLGYAVTKVLGTNGRPALAWQNHFEATASMKDHGMEKWIDYLKQYDQIPSFSLVREAYDWGVWKEGLAYYPNKGAPGQAAFEGEQVDSQYSSGRLVRDETGSQFSLEPYPEFKNLSRELAIPYRTYVDVADVDGDGVPEAVTGSGSGLVVLYPGVLRDGIWSLGAAEPALLESGAPLRASGGFATPVFADLNGDALPDLVVGSADGTLRGYVGLAAGAGEGSNGGVPGETPGREYAAESGGASGDEGKGAAAAGVGLRFREVPIGVAGSPAGAYAAPAVADLNGDGVPDLVVGGADGRLVFHAGARHDSAAGGFALRFSPQGVLLREGTANKDDRFAAPRAVDLDGSGAPALLVGGNDGYIRKFAVKQDGSGAVTLSDEGYLEGETMNPYGNYRLWGGRNSVPASGDLDGDGQVDLLVGQLIFGYPVPIDDPAFPYREELERSLAYAKAHHIDIQPHLFFHSYESAGLEEEEIALHRRTFEAYGLPWAPTGTNQHTWRVNNLDPVQTIRAEMNAGIWWNSGFRPAANPYEPSLAGEYLWTMPFLLSEGERVEPFVVANPSPDLSFFDEVYDSYAALDMPITHFYHMEYAILEQESESGYARKVKFLDEFRNKHDYNFMTEEQMFRSVMAAYQADAALKTPFFRNAWNSISNLVRTKQALSVNVRTEGLRDMPWRSEPGPELQENVSAYLRSVGFKVELGSKYAGYVPATDAPVAMYRDAALYWGGTDDARIWLATSYPDQPRVERANLPVRVERTGEGLRIDWLAAGLQQAKLYAPEGLQVSTEGWKLEAEADGRHYVLTRMGDASALEIRFK